MDNSGYAFKSLHSQHSLHQQEARIDSVAEFVVNEHSHNPSSPRPVEFFDIVLVCSSQAVQQRNMFLEFCKSQNWKVYLPSRERIGGEDDFSSFKRGHDQSTYIVILLTRCFQQDVWAVNRFQIALKRAIEERRQNVIPIVFGDSTLVPFELSAIASISYDDEFFDHVMKRTIKTDQRFLNQKKYDEAFSLQKDSNESQMVAKMETDSMDSGSRSYADVFNSFSTESQPSMISERYLNTRQFQELCMNLDIEHPSLCDWRGLAQLLEFKSNQITLLEQNSMKTGYSASKQILDVYFYCNRNVDKSTSLTTLHEMFRKMNFGKGIRITSEALQT